MKTGKGKLDTYFVLDDLYIRVVHDLNAWTFPQDFHNH